MHIIAWMDDMDMSAHLAKLSTNRSYQLEFIERKITRNFYVIIELSNYDYKIF